MTVLVSLSRLLYPYDLGGYEACVWSPARMIANWINPYNFATREPFIAAPYGPLYYLMVGFGLRSFGDQFWFGRALSLVAAVICVVSVVRISSVITHNRAATALALLTALSVFPLQNWLGFQRPDLPALALALLGLNLVFTSDDQHDHITLRSFLVVLLFVAAFFCKHTMFLFVGVAAIRGVQMGNRRNAAFAFLATGAVCLFIMLAINLPADAGHYWQHWVLARSVPRSPARSLDILLALLKEPTTWIVAAVIATGVIRYIRTSSGSSKEGKDNPQSRSGYGARRFLYSPAALILTYLAAASALAFATSSLAGANVNYWLEAALVAAIAVAVSWTYISAHGVGDSRFVLVVLLLTLSSGFTLTRMVRGEYYRWKSLPYYNEIVAALGEMTPAGEACISTFPEFAAYANREYHFGDWIQYYDGRSPVLEGIFRDAVASRRYPAIVWSSPEPFPGYDLKRMSTPLPDKSYPVYLFVRRDLSGASIGTGVADSR